MVCIEKRPYTLYGRLATLHFRYLTCLLDRGHINLNLLLDVGFNREVAQDAAMYWTKDDGNLAQLIDDCENIDREQIGNKAKERIKTAYSWEFISERYNQIWNT